MLSAWGMRKPQTEGASRAAGYVFLLSTVGLAAVFYFAYASFFVLRQACPLCLTMYVSVVGIFLVSASAAGPLRRAGVRYGEGSERFERQSHGRVARSRSGSSLRPASSSRSRRSRLRAAVASGGGGSCRSRRNSLTGAVERVARVARSSARGAGSDAAGERQGPVDQVQRLSVPVVPSGAHALQGHHCEVRGRVSRRLRVREPRLPARNRVRRRRRSRGGVRGGRGREAGEGEEPGQASSRTCSSIGSRCR